MKLQKLELFVDGASRGNPGPAGLGVVIKDEHKKTVREFYKYLGTATNNIAEYSALVYGLQEALMLGAEDITLHMDSELVVRQLKGEFRVRDANLKKFFDQAIHLIGGLKRCEIVHIKREFNKEADRLANKALNLAELK
ncbi:MAG: ribonuclease HI family protein [Candidatus Omnitrophota bacterium]